MNEETEYQFWGEDEDEDRKILDAILAHTFRDWLSSEDDKAFAYLQEDFQSKRV